MQQNEWDLPPPASVRPVRPPAVYRWLIALVALVAFAVASFFVPVPMFYAFLPGPVRDVNELIEIEDAPTYSSEGTLYLTTVSVDTDVTVSEWVASIFDPDKAVVMKSALTGGGSLEDLEKQQRAEMAASKRDAQEVVFEALGLGGPRADGARVARTLPGTPAAEVLVPGDVIVAIDGRSVSSRCDVGRIVNAYEAGDRLRITVRRDGQTRSYEIRTVPDRNDPGAALLGVYMVDINHTFEPAIDVRFQTGHIAGPSAGLMMSLALYDRLTPDDLTHGRDIAGTGEIQCDGGVGAIGGVEQKVAGAELRGADIFLAPAANAAGARAAADDIRIVAVSSFEEAVTALDDL